LYKQKAEWTSQKRSPQKVSIMSPSTLMADRTVKLTIVQRIPIPSTVSFSSNNGGVSINHSAKQLTVSQMRAIKLSSQIFTEVNALRAAKKLAIS
jgi:hypothetical protein